MADSWEQHAEKKEDGGNKASGVLNPDASSFSFNPSAGDFVPGESSKEAAPMQQSAKDGPREMNNVEHESQEAGKGSVTDHKGACKSLFHRCVQVDTGGKCVR